MSKSMERYQDLYSKYIDHSVELHNYHLVFITHTGYDTSLGVRKHLRAMRELQSEMIKSCRLAYVELREQRDQERKDRLRQCREEKARKLAEKAQRKKEKQNAKHNRSNESSV